MFVSAITSAAGVAAKVLGGVYLADFVSGAFHWMEDRYGDPKWPILGHTIRENQQHHHTPRSFLKGNLWTRNREVILIGLAFLGLFWAVGWLNLFTGTAVIFGMFANEIHACAHRSPKENGRIIPLAQKIGIMQSHRHHAAHHRKGKDSHYCVMTNHLNPALEKVQFFQRVEKGIKFLTGVVPRLDDSVNPRYRRAV
ncbi:fatty acid desaturase CarF family protein [Henriciella sp. AS95]|uniref:fatty acid desaturase CarF family protein n=1 Tax=Henriciella sp. AS95 TaxID=3135782 RepID=UPI00317017BE